MPQRSVFQAALKNKALTTAGLAKTIGEIAEETFLAVTGETAQTEKRVSSGCDNTVETCRRCKGCPLNNLVQ